MSTKYVIEVFYTNINFSNGGTEKYIKAQILELKKNDISSIVLFPIKVLKKYIVLWGIQVDDSPVSIVSSTKLYEMFGKLLKKKNVVLGIFVHHLLGVSLQSLQKIIEIMNPVPVYFFIHDFYTICAQLNFLKNNLMFCGGASLNNSNCNFCKFGIESKKNIKIFSDFFSLIEKERLIIVAPSEYVKKEWIKVYSKFQTNIIVCEHQKGIGTYTDNSELISKNQKIKIAYIGVPTRQKGWESWKRFVESAYSDGYQLYQFGPFCNTDNSKNIININVSIQRDGENAMIEALRSNKIEVAVLNSISPETYSSVYHECLASNLFIITNQNSGNVAAKVLNYRNGLVLKKEMDLLSFLGDKQRVLDMVNAYRKKESIAPEYLVTNRELIDSLLKKGEKSNLGKVQDLRGGIDIIGPVISLIYKTKYRSKIRVKCLKNEI